MSLITCRSTTSSTRQLVRGVHSFDLSRCEMTCLCWMLLQVTWEEERRTSRQSLTPLRQSTTEAGKHGGLSERLARRLTGSIGPTQKVGCGGKPPRYVIATFHLAAKATAATFLIVPECRPGSVATRSEPIFLSRRGFNPPQFVRNGETGERNLDRFFGSSTSHGISCSVLVQSHIPSVDRSCFSLTRPDRHVVDLYHGAGLDLSSTRTALDTFSPSARDRATQTRSSS
jgi:hypothetical protein